MKENFPSGDPVEYSGFDLSIDELKPVFYPDGSIDITTEHMSQVLKEGMIVRLASNKSPDQAGFAKVTQINKEGQLVKLELLD